MAVGVMALASSVPEEGGVEDKLRAVMRAAPEQIWFSIDPDIQIRCSIGAVMEHYGKNSDEWERLTHELESIKLLNAGLQVGSLDALIAHTKDGPEPIGIIRIWEELHPRA